MGPIGLGVKGYEVEGIAIHITNSESAQIVLTDWRSLATNLGIPSLYVESLAQDFLLDKFSFDGLICNVLAKWVECYPSVATFDNLLNIIGEKLGWTDIAGNLANGCNFEVSSKLSFSYGLYNFPCIVESLYESYHTVIPTGSTWTDLSSRTKEKIKQREVMFLETRTSLDTLLENFTERERDDFYQTQSVDSMKLLLSSDSTCTLLKSNIPKELSYYIPRVMSIETRMNKQVFEQHTSDKFVIDGMSIRDLESLAGNESFVDSRPVLQCYQSKFIRLIEPADYMTICQTSNNEPVHLIRYDDGKFYWMQSFGNMNSIRDFLDNEKTLTDEQNVMSSAQTNMFNNPVIIADCPGMGKSVLLAALCRLANPQHLNLFYPMTDLVARVKQRTALTLNDVFAIFEDITATTTVGQELLGVLLKNGTIRKQIFLDAFDEIHSQKQHIGIQILKLLHMQPNIQIFVTTRLHKQIQLENALNCISYKIWPLKQPQQINLIVDFWRDAIQLESNDTVRNFAKQVATGGLRNLDTKELEFAGIPLQCKMLAELHQEDALLYATTHEYVPYIHVETQSIYEMYTKIVDLKMSRAEERLRDAFMEWHMKISLQHLFPEYCDEIENMSRVEMSDNSFEIINGIGIVLNQSAFNSLSSKMHMFVHRSFAEYLVSRWLIQNENSAGTIGQLWHKILFEKVLSPASTLEEEFLIVTKDILVDDLHNYMAEIPSAEACREAWKEILLSLNVSPERIEFIERGWKRHVSMELTDNIKEWKDILCWIIVYWTEEGRSPRPLVHLINALDQCGLSDAAANLEEKFYKKDFASGTVCYLLDSARCVSGMTSGAIESDIDGALSSRPKSSQETLTKAYLHAMFEACMRHDYTGLFTFICEVLPKANELGALKLLPWIHVLEEACSSSSRDLVVALCDFMENNLGHVVSKIHSEYLKSSNHDTTKSLLHITAKRGCFPVFDFLYKTLKPTEEELKLIIHYCVENTTKSSDVIINEKLEILQYLISRHPTFLEDRWPGHGGTAMHGDNIHLRILEKLIIAGVDVYATDGLGETVAHKAGRFYSPTEFHGFVELMIKFDRKLVFMVEDKNTSYPLHTALQFIEVDEKTIELLSETGAINFKVEEGYMYVSLLGVPSTKPFEALVKAGCNPLRLFADGETHLHYAAFYGHIQIMNYLLSLGIDANVKDKTSRTPLHMAFTFQNRNIHGTVRTLLDNGADVNAVDNDGYKPLWFAVNGEDLGTISERTIALLEEAASSDNKQDDKKKV